MELTKFTKGGTYKGGAMKKKQSHRPVCGRCGEPLISQIDFMAEFKERKLHLNIGEALFIKLKHRGLLCFACQNQLRTSYKISQGFYSQKV